MKSQLRVCVLATLAIIPLVAMTLSSQSPPVVPIDPDDIGGVVRGPNGPEAGVWVVAETRRSQDGLPQDGRDRRSRALRASRSAQRELHRSGCAATAWSTRAKVTSPPRAAAAAHRGARADAARRGAVLPGELLVLAHQGAGRERVSDGHDPPPGAVDLADEEQSLPDGVTKATRELHPKLQDARLHDTHRRAALRDRSPGRCPRSRSSSRASRCSPTGSIALPQATCRRRRRARRDRTQSRRDDVGCVEPDSVHARRRQRRQAQSADESRTARVYGVEFHNDGLVVLDPLSTPSGRSRFRRRSTSR